MSKRIHFIFIIFTSFILCSFNSAQQDEIENIKYSMKNGNAGTIALYFDNTVDLTYDNTQSTYSKIQAEMILRDFYLKHSPKNFNVDYLGNSPNNDAQYLIATLQTSTGKYRVYMYFRNKDGKKIIKEIKISK
jgi:hypothetical protein